MTDHNNHSVHDGQGADQLLRGDEDYFKKFDDPEDYNELDRNKTVEMEGNLYVQLFQLNTYKSLINKYALLRTQFSLITQVINYLSKIDQLEVQNIYFFEIDILKL
ncbi:hypothetical protein ABPG74_014319 [Tetrahymena malaccensis]